MGIVQLILSCVLLLQLHSVEANKFLRSNSLLTCMENSEFTSTYFDVYYYPHNSTAVFYVDGSSSLSGKIKADISLVVYGLNVYQDSIDLCSLGYDTICPISAGHIDVQGTYTIETDLTSQIPSVAYHPRHRRLRQGLGLLHRRQQQYQPLGLLESRHHQR